MDLYKANQFAIKVRWTCINLLDKHAYFFSFCNNRCTCSYPSGVTRAIALAELDNEVCHKS